ncbi:MAG: hypothetical protein IM569_02500 [Chitinophagaceae bacterium]|nr:hypothetical protein [Chitinophagaceae bacterium]
MPGACQAEWIDDRIQAFIRRGYTITIVSASCCIQHKDRQITHIRIPALSPHAAAYEYDESKRRNLVTKKGITYRYIQFMSTLDRLLGKIHLRSGEGRWSWFISSLWISIFKIRVKEFDFIYTTGGPAGAHLTGIVLSKLFRKKLLCEFQDPLSGSDIGRNKFSKFGLAIFEKLIIWNADFTIYCTKNAMVDSQSRFPSFAERISYVYPGSIAVEQYLQHANVQTLEKNLHEKINITYLGSLYLTRNLDTLMKAIDELAKEGTPVTNILVNIYGNMNADIRERILNFKYSGIFIIHGLISREEAMQKALMADVLLLVQNIDNRSINTIPFKTYDYLHTGKRILALTYRNDEIDNMLTTHGHWVCQADDVNGMKDILVHLKANIADTTHPVVISKYTPDYAVNSMLALLSNQVKNSV